jgi:alpha-beta hydrolase superfamily lysophospholipase
VAPVVDFALTLAGVDAEKIALMGISMGGVLAPRAAAFEKRISALIANDGLYDFGAAILASIPPKLQVAAEAGLIGNASISFARWNCRIYLLSDARSGCRR